MRNYKGGSSLLTKEYRVSALGESDTSETRTQICTAAFSDNPASLTKQITEHATQYLSYGPTVRRNRNYL